MKKFHFILENKYDELGFFIEQTKRKCIHGYVYTLRIKDTNIFKIGKTTNIKQRLSQLRSNTKLKLELLALIATDDIDILETELQVFYKNTSLPQSEWFIYDEEDIMKNDWITGICDCGWYDSPVNELIENGNKVLEREFNKLDRNNSNGK